MTDFIHYRSWGIFFAALLVTTAAYFIGLGRTRIIMFSTALLAGCNIILDYGLIFGKLGLPEMGMTGAPVASSISEAIAFLFLCCYALWAPSFREFRYNLRRKIRKSLSIDLLRLSYPIMFQGVISLSTWLVFFSMIEHMGPNDLEAAHNIRYMYFLAFVPIFGFAAATRTFVSNLVGQNRRDLIPKIQRKIAILSVLFILIIFHGSLFYPEKLIALVNQNPDIHSDVMQNSNNILRFVSGSIFIFAYVIVPFNSVSALGETKVLFLIELGAIVIYLFACYLFIERWQWNIVEVWLVEYIYFITLGVLSVVYLYYYRKKDVTFG